MRNFSFPLESGVLQLERKRVHKCYGTQEQTFGLQKEHKKWQHDTSFNSLRSMAHKYVRLS